MYNVLSTEWKNKMIKMKYNKKRNTAFLYEVLIKEYTKSVVRKEEKKRKQCLAILKEFFSGSILKKEKDLINTIIESKDIPNELGEKFLFEVKKSYDNMRLNQVWCLFFNCSYAIKAERGVLIRGQDSFC